jgi:general secretion pathway protein A
MYNGHFNFCESPFGVTPDPQFYYSNPVYEEALATLRYGVEERKGFTVITGQAGTGKTTLIRKALNEFNPNVKSAYIPISLLASNDLLDAILTDLGVEHVPKNPSAMIECLSYYLTEQHELGKIIAVLLDEAQNLSFDTLEELRELSNLETRKHKLLQIVLVGQLELEDKLDHPKLRQLKQRVVLRGRLRPVAGDEVASYIYLRLRAVGNSSATLFDNLAIERIAYYSGGIPRLINIICDNALLTAYALSARRVNVAMVEEVAADLRLRPADNQNVVDTIAAGDSSGLELEPAPPPQPLRDDLTDLKVDKQAAAAQTAQRWESPRLVVSAAMVLLISSGLFIYSMLWLSDDEFYRVATTKGSGHKEGEPVATGAPSVPKKTQTMIPRHGQAAAASDEHAARVKTKQTMPAFHAKRTAETEPFAAPGGVLQAKKPHVPPLGGTQKNPAKNDNFVVTAASFVRSKPSSKAAILTTLRPGTRIKVTGITGEYFRVRALGTERVSGYVHKEDAFFEPKG